VGSWGRRAIRTTIAETPRTTAAAAVAFVALALVLAFVPVPYVAWSPGRTEDVLGPAADGSGQAIRVSGLTDYPTTGQLRLTTVSVTRVDSPLTLPAALAAHWLPWRYVLPRAAVYPPGTTAEENTEANTRMMDSAQQSAVVSALRAAEVTVTPVAMVVGVTDGSPADGTLEPGDTIVSVDGRAVDTPAEAVSAIRDRRVGDPVRLVIRRADARREVEITTGPSDDDSTRPMIGAVVDTGYDHPGTVDFGIDPSIGGPSAGLVFALAVYDRLTPGDLTAGRVIAGTGTIDVEGDVGSIGGIGSKIRGAENDGARLFLLPEDNCTEVADLSADIPLVPVSTLDEAIAALTTPVDDLPHCP